MDEFKRTYSNQDTATVALPYFWKHFEKDNYSLWFCEYKYANELTLTFMSSNLIGGN
jgi:elongation factor 1-gamma